MNIKKRNGKIESLKFDKIVKRIEKQTYGLDLNYVDHNKIALSVFNGLYDGATVQQIDELIAEASASLSTIHPDYSILASRIVVSSLHKETNKSFSATVKKLYEDKIVNKDFYECVQRNREILDSSIIHDRDFSYDYFGIKTLISAYLLKDANKVVLERPQYMIMRVCVSLWKDNIEEVLRSYEFMSNKFFTHATPTLFNAGTLREQLSSCFLLTIDDSIEDIYKILSDCAKISQSAGGIGLCVSNIRANGSTIKGTNGISDGIVPMLKVYNDTACYVNQSGKRKGSFAVYLEPWHADVFDFLDLKKTHGKEEMRARDLFYALWVPDLFMEQVQKDGDWYLMCPSESIGLVDAYGEEFNKLYNSYVEKGIYRKKIKARELYTKIIDSQIETGTPYMSFKDSVNNKSNQKNLGTIKSSNLCVSPDTKLLTKDGYITIGDNEGKEVDVWNGKEWSNTKIVKTGENQELLRIKFSNGSILDCTPYHKFYIQTGYNKGTGKNRLSIEKKDACDLTIGDKLIKLTTPVIDFDREFVDAYTQGFFSGDGCSYKNKNHIDLYGEKIKLLPKLKYNSVQKYYETSDRQRIIINHSYVKYNVPTNYSIKSRVNWLAGLCDSDGVLCKNNDTESIQICSIHFEFLDEIKLMLQTLGIQSKVCLMNKGGYKLLPNKKGGEDLYNCKDSYRLLIGFDGIQKLNELGFVTNRLNININNKPNRNCEHFVKVVSIEKLDYLSDTYCVNEPSENKVVFNGVVTGNCNEIVEYTSKDEQAVCNLSSIALPKFVTNDKFDFDLLHKVAYQNVKNLNQVIDINFYPTPETRNSNLRHRPVAVGVQGLADVFALLKLPFDSDKAKILNKQIFETIYHGALQASCDIAKKDGAYSSYKGSPISKGIFQFDMWKSVVVNNTKDGMQISSSSNVELSGLWDWDALREDIMKYGVRNSLTTASMPTASTSQILGNNECFEPYTSNIYSRRTLHGTFTLVNKHLIKDLIEIGLWNDSMRKLIIANEGSVQNIDVIPQNLKSLYKTVWEIKQKDLIDMSADRGAFIDQTQSLNLFFENINHAKISSSLLYGWLKGLKTGSYYIRQQTKASANKSLGIDLSSIKEQVFDSNDSVSCSLDNPEACIACSA